MNLTSLTVSFSETYSTFVLERVTQGCALDFQEIETPERNIKYPVILFRSFLSPAKSELL
jgi:hypothetical protein